MNINDILTHRKFPAGKERFWSRVDKGEPDECWNWRGTFEITGYGLASISGSTQRTHRVAWVLTNGPIPKHLRKRRYCVCHTCDNRACCNPAHLWLGTDGENAADMTAKGRVAQGERHYMAKLTVEQVLDIRRDPRGARELAEQYQVSKATIYGVRHRETWRDLNANTPERIGPRYPRPRTKKRDPLASGFDGTLP